MAFFQAPPALDNQYRGDRVLRSYLARTLPDDVRRAIEPALDENPNPLLHADVTQTWRRGE